MNYQMLKTLLDSLIANFICPNCKGKITDNNIEIIGAAGKNLNLNIFCSNCEKYTFIKAEVGQINLGNILNLKQENIDNLKQNLVKQISNMKDFNFGKEKKNESKINDKEILELRKILKSENIKVEDFFK